ncbi:MAG: DUF4294 domain-containing protein [Alphaproteobacteria bacterium]|nr:DUF4294 domain-containing protein [Alphaproteobacteria bacterium]
MCKYNDSLKRLTLYLKWALIGSIYYFSTSIDCFSQRHQNDTITMFAIIEKESGDTIPFEILPEFICTKIINNSKLGKKNTDWNRLRNAVYVTYPYAKICAKLIKEINVQLIGITNKKERKSIVKNREKELRKSFEDKLKKLSVYQGRILMKLIYRQSNNSCYEIIKEYKGGFTAFMSQTLMILFGGNLKLEYDKEGQDKDIEKIVLEYEKFYNIHD